MLSILITASLVAVPLAAGSPAAKSTRPNVILIVTDDQGIGDFSIMGNPVLKTPNLDKLGAGGTRMTRFYVSPVCTPTRACLMTGRYNYRTRAIDTYAGRAMMEPDEITVAEVLRDADYATGIFGKWHLGDNYPLRAMDQGFAESLIISGGGIGQPSDPPGGEGKYTDPVVFHNGRQMQARGYCTDVYFRAAGDWIEKCNRQGQNFFAYIATNAPHSPLNDVPKELYEQYRKKDLRPVLFGAPQGKPTAKELDDLARIFAMVANIDGNVGGLVRKLESLKLLDNTLVLFLTDNGPGSPRRYTANLRGKKGDVYEGGIRTVFFAHWPARLKAGAECDVPAAHVDVMPTILEACGVEKPAKVRFDGRSMLPLLEGRQVEWPKRTICIQSHRGDAPILYHNFAAIGGTWKLLNASGFNNEVFTGPPQFELYDLASDPGEKHNVAKQRPEVVKQLKEAYAAWFEDVSSTRPANYAPPRIAIGTPHENPVRLTRQNWRRGPASGQVDYGTQGTWLLQVAREANCDIRLRFPSAESAGTAEISVQDVRRSMPVAASATECIFKDVPLVQGEADLQGTVICGDQTNGPWQVDINMP